MEALLEEMPPTPGNLLDLLRGAFDARVRGDWPGRRRRRPRSLARLLSTVAAAIGLLAATGVGLLFFVPQLGVVAPALGILAVGLLLASAYRRLRRRRHWYGGYEGGEGSRVPAKPAPDAPPALTAASPGSGTRSGRD
jgi:hypothetical protein